MINQKELIKNIHENILGDDCVLMIGPDAFLHYKGNETLSDRFVSSVRKKIVEEYSENYAEKRFDTKRENVISATIKIHEVLRRGADKWLYDFWNKIDRNDYPLINHYAQLPFKGYIYLGYDNLLYQSIKSFANNTHAISCQDSKKHFHINNNNDKIRNDDAGMDMIEKLYDDILIINCYGNIRNNIASTDDLIYRVYDIVSEINTQSDKSPLKHVCGNLSANNLIIVGSEMSFWHNKILALLFKDAFKGTTITREFYERNHFHNQIDSKLFLETVGVSHESTIEIKETEKLVNSAIRNNYQGINKLRSYENKAFISYATEDKSIVDKVAFACQQRSIYPYVAHDDRTKASEIWKTKVRGMLDDDRTNWFIIIGTSTYIEKLKNSDALIYECTKANDNGLKILALDFTNSGINTCIKYIDKDFTWQKINLQKNEDIFEILRLNIL